MTLAKKDYLKLMAQKGITETDASPHFDRIAKMMANFNADRSNLSLGLFGPVDVGQNIYWWDYGLLRLYQKNALLISERSTEAELMRLFFNIGTTLIRDSTVINTAIDSVSSVASCRIGTEGMKTCGSVRNSVLCNVKCNSIDAEGCILINVTADSIVAKPGCIIYNIVDESAYGLDLSEGQVLAGVFTDDGSQLVMKSATSIDGGKAWEQKLEWNPRTFEDVYNMNTTADPINLEEQIKDKHSKHWATISTAGDSFVNPYANTDYVDKRESSSYWSGFVTGGLSVLALSAMTATVVLLRTFVQSQK